MVYFLYNNYLLRRIFLIMLVNREANYHVKREKGGVMFPVKAPIVPVMMLHRDSKETEKKNLTTMMSSDLDNILEVN